MEPLSQAEIKRHFKLLAKALNIGVVIALLGALLLQSPFAIFLVLCFCILSNISLAVNYWLSKEGIRDHRFHKFD